jgi:hypothetical protein
MTGRTIVVELVGHMVGIGRCRKIRLVASKARFGRAFKGR